LPAFFFVPAALDTFRLPQRALAEWLGLASLLALVPALARLAWRDVARRPIVAVVLPLLLVAACGLAVTAHPVHVADALADLAIGVAVLVGWSIAVPAPTLRRLLDATLLPAALLSVLAILQLHHLWQPLVFSGLWSERLGVTSLAGNPGDLAALLVLPCLVAQAGLSGASRAGRWARLGVLGLVAYALVGTQTLTSLAAMLAGSFVLWTTMAWKRKVLAIGGAAVLAILLVAVLVGPVRERIALRAHQMDEAVELNSLLSGRLDGWRVAARLLGEHPWTGVGWGAYRAEFVPAKLRLLHEGAPFFGGHISPSFANAHDEYLEVGADLGWPGLLAIASAIALVLRQAWRARSRLSVADRALVWGGLVALALLALAYFPLRLGPVAFSWLAWLAWLFAGEAVERGEEAGRPSPRVGPILAIAIAAAFVAQSVRGWRQVEASVLVRSVQRLMVGTAGVRLPGRVVAAQDAALRRAHRLHPAAVEPLAFRADLLHVAGRLADAESAYHAAAAHEPRAETLFNWGVVLSSRGVEQPAAVQLRRGVALMPQLEAQVPSAARAAVERTPLVPIPPLDARDLERR
jgi:O-antigen ligase